MITVTSAQLYAWIAAFMWPLARILGLVSVAPLFGNIGIPARVKLGLGIMLALVIAPGLPAVPAPDPMSLDGVLVLAREAMIGLAMGFAMRIVLAAVELAGEVMGMTMGLGFATFYDPQTRANTSAIGQLLALLTLLIFIATNLHLVLLAALADSFASMPIAPTPPGTGMFRQLTAWAGSIFSSGLQLALPVVAALLVTNLALGILTRAAPQLNLFGIGFPITIGAGFLMLALVLPYLAVPVQNLLQQGLETVGRMVR